MAVHCVGEHVQQPEYPNVTVRRTSNRPNAEPMATALSVRSDSERTQSFCLVEQGRVSTHAGRQIRTAASRQIRRLSATLFSVVAIGDAGLRTSLADALHTLDNAAKTRQVCLAAKGFFIVEAGVEPSLDHILDLSDVRPRNPRTNASIATAVIEYWPEDPSQFAVELSMASIVFPCPCCGHLTFDEPPGSYSLCAVCFWEDDVVQLRWPMMQGGANRPTLIEAQVAFEDHGAMERHFVPNVRPPLPDEPVEDGWRTIDPRRDSFEALDDRSADWPDDYTQLYWWRPSFWRAGQA